MIVLRNLLMSVVAFFVAGYGFYAFLVYVLPPDQIISEQVKPADVAVVSVDATSPLLASLGGLVESWLPAAPGTTHDNVAVEVPDWLGQRFDQEASAAGKTLTLQDKMQLLGTLLALRDLRMQRSAQSAPATGQGAEQTLASLSNADWALTARAMQAEMQYRQILGIGLAEFVKKLDPQQLSLLLSQSVLSQSALNAPHAPTAAVR